MKGKAKKIIKKGWTGLPQNNPTGKSVGRAGPDSETSGCGAVAPQYRSVFFPW
jgi:hypothetical protein